MKATNLVRLLTLCSQVIHFLEWILTFPLSSLRSAFSTSLIFNSNPWKEDIYFNIILLPFSASVYLHNNIDKDDHEGVDEADEQPDLHRLDAGRVGQRGGDREIDRGQDHHAGDVHRDYQLIPALPGDVVGQLVDHVHHQGREVGYHYRHL